MFNLTSRDVSEEIRGRINACQSLAEVVAIRDSVKPPSECKAGDPDLAVWWACTAVIDAEQRKQRDAQAEAPAITEQDLAVMEWVNSPAYDEE